jgi:hypothetical protein
MLFVITIKRSVICNRDTWRRKELTRDRITMENTHDKYCDTLSNFGAYNTTADIAERQFVLHYSGRRHANGNLFQRLECHRRRTGRVTSTAFVNSGGARTVRILTSEDPKISAVRR